ncbi:helix-turn-helix transcriptional regulator [Dactylosporangium darangshiense]|uniref:helix-turn-helix transcriptional regulator n=1 Tax=Dactylosporangium darangshiense TaxID=579108 RepID=UPI0036325177
MPARARPRRPRRRGPGPHRRGDADRRRQRQPRADPRDPACRAGDLGGPLRRRPPGDPARPRVVRRADRRRDGVRGHPLARPAGRGGGGHRGPGRGRRAGGRRRVPPPGPQRLGRPGPPGHRRVPRALQRRDVADQAHARSRDLAGGGRHLAGSPAPVPAGLRPAAAGRRLVRRWDGPHGRDGRAAGGARHHRSPRRRPPRPGGREAGTVGPRVARAVATATSQSGRRSARRPDPRELQVLELLADGRTYREIGELLFISPRTAEKHGASASAKLGVRGKYQLGLLYQQHARGRRAAE